LASGARTLSDDARKQQIVAAAKSCFAEYGLSATRMDEVAQRAGLSKGGLYFHFPSKESLLVAVVEHENAAMESLLSTLRSGFASLREGVEHVVPLAFRYLQHNRPAAVVAQSFMEEALRNPLVADAVRRGEALFLASFEAVFAEAQRRGEVPPHVNTRLAAQAAMLVVEGVKSQYLHFPDWSWEELLAWFTRAILSALEVERP
jgi:AcrR family transcriptional regulator